MPKGPKGEKRPADVIGAAVIVGRIATGKVEETQGPIKEFKRAFRKIAPKLRGKTKS